MALWWFVEIRIPMLDAYIRSNDSVSYEQSQCISVGYRNEWKLVVSKTNTCYATRLCCSCCFSYLSLSVSFTFTCCPPLFRFPILLTVSYQLSDKLRVYKNGKPTFGFLLCIASVLLVVSVFSPLLLCHTFDFVPMAFFSSVSPERSLLLLLLAQHSFGCFHFSFLFAFCTPMTNKNLEGGANLYKQLMLALSPQRLCLCVYTVCHWVVTLYQNFLLGGSFVHFMGKRLCVYNTRYVSIYKDDECL